MEPIPETVQALSALDSGGRAELSLELRHLADRAQAVIPDLIGVSIGRLDYGLTFTLVASAEELALLDAVQYLHGGPCVDAAHTNQVIGFVHDDALDEQAWRIFAQATAAHAVRSTLTLPLVAHERVVGTVNLYAGSGQAFVGHHDRLAGIFGAWASGAVENADLDFSTREEAQDAPERVHAQFVIDMAIGLTAADLGVDVETAEAHMVDAAARAGVTLSHLAQTIVDAHRERDLDED